MTFLGYALIGYVIGILTTAPVGPVNIMAIQHAVQGGFRQGVYVGLGAVLAELIFAACAVFGVSAVTTFIDNQFNLIEIVGGALLLGFGLKIWHTHPHLDAERNGRKRGFYSEAAAAFFMAITNPGAVFAFIAIFGGLGEYRPAHSDHLGALVMVAGVAGGATTWWVIVSAAVSHYKNRIDDRWLNRINHIAGFLLVAFGCLIYLNLAWKVLLKAA